MNKTWWKEAVMYQIYPRSFQDSNGDGIGDIQGIIRRIPHLVNLGVNVIWLGPIYDSPNDDNGYDIRDYRKIHPEFGTMDDFDELLGKLHDSGIRLIMDLVVNHTSDEHEWFVQSRSSRESPYRDYYYWEDEPNNYLSFFGGSAWEETTETDQYYLHLFTKKQPDLNWENPKVREEVYDIMRFWLDKGIDGYRMDVISLLSKRLPFVNSENTDLKYLIDNKYANGPRIHEFLSEMNDKVLRHYDIMTVGEGPGITKEHVLNYVGSDRHELNMVFQLELMFVDFGPRGKFDYTPFSNIEIKKSWLEWDRAVGKKGWNNIFLDNHDFPRLVSRFGNDKEYRIQSAKLFALLLMTFRGTPCIYQGTEMGMTNVAYDSLDDYDDVELQNYRKEFVGSGKMNENEFLKIAHIQARDNARTPLQWDDSPEAGFTTGTPWINVNQNYREINQESSRMIYEFYAELIAYRKSHPELVYAELENIDEDHPSVFYYRRGNFYVLLNMSDEKVNEYPINLDGGEVLFSVYDEKIEYLENIDLKPWEGMLIYRSK